MLKRMKIRYGALAVTAAVVIAAFGGALGDFFSRASW
jgi:hypothetical protein